MNERINQHGKQKPKDYFFFFFDRCPKYFLHFAEQNKPSDVTNHGERGGGGGGRLKNYSIPREAKQFWKEFLAKIRFKQLTGCAKFLIDSFVKIKLLGLSLSLFLSIHPSLYLSLPLFSLSSPVSTSLLALFISINLLLLTHFPCFYSFPIPLSISVSPSHSLSILLLRLSPFTATLFPFSCPLSLSLLSLSLLFSCPSPLPLPVLHSSFPSFPFALSSLLSFLSPLG